MKTINKKFKIFLVDDDRMFLQALGKALSDNKKLDLIYFHTGEECLKSINEKRQAPDVVVLDYYLDSGIASAMNGVAVLKKIKKISPDTEVIMLSSQDNMNITLATLKNGAYDYVIKGESAFLKVENLILHITNSIASINKYTKEEKIYKLVNVITIVVFLLVLIFQKIFQKGG